MSTQLERIKDKLEWLKKLDSKYMLFGSGSHLYKLNPILSVEKIRQFESAHKITLPTGYVEFLTTIGNGGAGPFYGLEPLENALFVDLDYKNPEFLLNPTKTFLHTEAWNMVFKPTVEYEENEEEYERQQTSFEKIYYADEHMNGAIAICNYGCAVSLNLVVNGQEYGHVWTDDRGSSNGIYPSHELGNEDKIGFLDWYELWLDNSLDKIKK